MEVMSDLKIDIWKWLHMQDVKAMTLGKTPRQVSTDRKDQKNVPKSIPNF